MRLPEIKKIISLACPDAQIESIRFLGAGDFCRAYLVNGETVFRFAKHEEARLSLARENCLLPKLAESVSLSIPEPRLFAFDAERPERSFIAYKILPGRVLTRKNYLGLAASERTLCAAQIGNFLNELHAFEKSEAVNCGVLTKNYEQQCKDLLRDARENLYDALDEPERRLIEQTANSHLELSGAESLSTVLLHGDLSPEHVLFDDGTNRIGAILDFGDLMIGDPAWDFLWIYEDYGLDFLARALAVYRAPDKNSLLRRVFDFSVLALVEWSLYCRKENYRSFPKALGQLKKLSRGAEKKRDRLLSILRPAAVRKNSKAETLISN